MYQDPRLELQDFQGHQDYRVFQNFKYFQDY